LIVKNINNDIEIYKKILLINNIDIKLDIEHVKNNYIHFYNSYNLLIGLYNFNNDIYNEDVVDYKLPIIRKLKIINYSIITDN